jgi:mRNA interferase MazF
MPFVKGSVYIANLNPNKGSEPGKSCPVLVFQNDWLNEIKHSTCIVLPLSTRLVDDAFPLRFRLEAGQALEKDSDILCDQVRAIDIQRLQPKVIYTLNAEQLGLVEECVALVLGLSAQ